MRKYENISLWRALSCIGVLLFHIFLQCCDNQFSFGKYGVLFFFIITGFLAFESADIQEDIRRYWKKRIVRIIPMYICVMGMWMALFVIQERSLQKGWELLTADFVGGTWTIWVTIVFYTIAPLLKRCVYCYWGGVLAFFIFCIPRCVYILFRLQALDKTWQYLCFCMGGVLIYFTFKEEKEHLTIFLLSVTIILFKLSSITDDYFFFFFVFMIIFISSRAVKIKGRGFQFIIVTIDKYSYNIYLIHPIVLFCLTDYQWYVQIIVGLSGTALLGCLSYQWIDEKIGKKVANLLHL